MSAIKYRQLVGDRWHYWGFLPSSDIKRLLFTGPVTNQQTNPIHCQFTGLTDKNGVEIYEGDIVEEYETDYSDSAAVERWLDGMADMPSKLASSRPDFVTMERFPIYWLSKESFGYEGEDLVSPKNCKVIGNIYQNPELLNHG